MPFSLSKAASASGVRVEDGVFSFSKRKEQKKSSSSLCSPSLLPRLLLSSPFPLQPAPPGRRGPSTRAGKRAREGAEGGEKEKKEKKNEGREQSVRIKRRQEEKRFKCILSFRSLSLSLSPSLPLSPGAAFYHATRTRGTTSSAACLEEAPSLVSMASQALRLTAPLRSSLFWFCGGISFRCSRCFFSALALSLRPARCCCCCRAEGRSKFSAVSAQAG